MGRELSKKLVGVAVVIGQALDLDPPRAILEPSFEVGDRPQGGEKDAGEWLAVAELLIDEEPWLDRAQPSHGPAPLSI